MNITTELAMFF